MNYFTHKYREVTTLDGISVAVSLKHDDHGRWICYAYKENIGRNGYQFTIIDNHLEKYTITWAGPGSNSIIAVSNGLSISGDRHFEIVCKAQNLELLPLPDFAIDVLQTVQTNTLYEVIRRIAVAFHEKNSKPVLAHVFTNYHEYRPVGMD